jgi:hypothetical protein
MSFAETSATRETAATLPAGLRLGAVHLTVTELDRSVAFYHVALLFDSRRALAHAALRLVATRTPIQGASDHGVSEAIYLADVDGNGIERYADRPREQWPAPTAPGERGHPHPRPRLAAVDRHRRGPAAAAPRRRRTDPRPRPPPCRRPGRRAAFCVSASTSGAARASPTRRLPTPSPGCVTGSCCPPPSRSTRSAHGAIASGLPVDAEPDGFVVRDPAGIAALITTSN